MKHFIFDVETTGLDANRHTIIQLGYIRTDLAGRRITTLLKMQPVPDADINLKALETSSTSLIELMSQPSPSLAYGRMLDELGFWVSRFDKQDKFIPVGYNVRFDLDFLRAWFLKVDPNGGRYFGSYFHTGAIDVWSLVALHLGEKILDLPNTKLITVAEACGLTVEQSETHNALYDAILTEQLFKLLKGEVR